MKSLLAVICLSVFCVSCAQLKVQDVPGNENMLSAAGYFYELRSEGHLPGIPATDKGYLRSEAIPISELHGRQDPLRMKFVYTPQKNKDFLYSYIVQRPDANSNWNLVEAWRTDQKGENKEELAVSK